MEVVDLNASRQRRLSDKLLAAFSQACDQEDLDVAAQLLKVVNGLMNRPNMMQQDRRKIEMTTVAAHERLWLLKHPRSRNDV